jgi:arginase
MEVIGVPFDLCGQHPGSRLGPDALRLEGLHDVLDELGVHVRDKGNLQVPESDLACTGIHHAGQAIECIRTVKESVLDSFGRGMLPLVIGGDHSIAIGSVSAALEHFGPDLAVLWIDAHADLNTPDTSPSGNLHGMTMAALLGETSHHEDEATNARWQEIQSMVPEHRLRSHHVAWLGIRELDAGEKKRLWTLPPGHIGTMHEVDRFGVLALLEHFDLWMRRINAKQLYISFDIDSLDPLLAPGTGTAVRGGLTYREMHLLGEILYELFQADKCPYQLVGLDVVEVNPMRDTNNISARNAVEFVGSLFGRTILGVRP